MPELKLYTIAQLRDWLMHNCAVEGLSERIIAPSRAWAIIHNPYVKDEDMVSAAIFVNREMVAFTAAFPEKIGDQRYWWFTSLWCDSRHQGKGYGLIVIGSLAERYGEEYILDRWGAQETRDIFLHFGSQIIYTPRYILGYKINSQTTKGKLVHMIRSTQKWLHRVVQMPQKCEDYKLRYITNIDDETYAFVKMHCSQDLFLRTQSMLNWILQYSFTETCPLIESTMPTTPFAPAKAKSNHIHAVQVWDNENVIGFYIMKHTDDDLHILYLYYDADVAHQVFASIRDHAQRMNISQFVTDNDELAAYMRKRMYFPKYKTMQVHFAYPVLFAIRPNAKLQYGDGDGFTAE